MLKKLFSKIRVWLAVKKRIAGVSALAVALKYENAHWPIACVPAVVRPMRTNSRAAPDALVLLSTQLAIRVSNALPDTSTAAPSVLTVNSQFVTCKKPTFADTSVFVPVLSLS